LIFFTVFRHSIFLLLDVCKQSLLVSLRSGIDVSPRESKSDKIWGYFFKEL